MIKVFLIIIASLAVIIYGGVFLGHKVFFREAVSKVPTIDPATDGTFIFGAQAHKSQPATMEEYVPILAMQLKKYNEIASALWPNNTLVNQTMIVEGLKRNKLWQIAPDGTVTPLSNSEAKKMDFTRSAYVDGFSFFKDGVYYAVAEEDLTNYLTWQKYLHLGTYDAILFLTHEGFHKTQEKWASMAVVKNGERDEFLDMDSLPARAKRALLQKQLLKAVSNPGSTELILEALATYADWKALFPDDYENSVYFDRIEGTAYYYELVTGLYLGYPEQVKNRDDLDRALALLATRQDIYVWHGLIKESYIVGGFSGVLLDRLGIDWKEQLMREPDATPIEMLYRHFKDETLPPPVYLTQAEVYAVIDAQALQESGGSSVLPRLFRFFYDILF